jgi:hemoglobin
VTDAIPTATTTPFDAVGGREGISAIVETFYRSVAADPEIRSVYPEDLEPGKAKLKLFFEQWLGGEPVYSRRYGHPRLRRRHFPFIIAEKHAGLWLRYMRLALQANGVPPATEAVLFERLAPLAHHIVNAHEDVPREPLGEAFLQ